MKIKITVFKKTGKFYTSDIVENDVDIPLFEDAFKRFVRDSIPANLGEGYIVVEDADENNQSFHIALYQYDSLFWNGFYFA